MSSTKEIKLISYDLEGVFFDDPRDRYITNLASYYRKDKKFIEDLLFNKAVSDGQYNELKEGKIDPQVYWDWLFEALEIEDEDKKTKADYLTQAMGYYEINSKISELILTLKSRGIKACLCSNNYKDKIDYLEDRYGLSSYFDPMVFSYEVGVQKPDKKIFQEVVKRSGVSADAILYTDDKEEKLAGAAQIGMKTYLYRGFEELKEKLKLFNIKV